jgi:hypothetical protein
MFDNITKARDAGVNLAFLSGNSVSGRVKLLPSSTGTPNRGMTLLDRAFKEADLMGSVSYGVGLASWKCAEPDHWVFEGTGMKKGDSIPQLVGWEFHGPPLADYESMVVLAEGPVTNFNGVPTQRRYASTIYTAPKGNFVFNAATCWWAKPLASPPAYIHPPYRYFAESDPRVQRITKNLLNRMISVDVNKATVAK